jgi:putative transposase
MSPDEVWAEWISKGWTPDVVPEDEAVDLFRPYEKRQTRRALVELFGNSYFAPELEGFHGEDVLVGFDTTDASRVWVRALDGRFIAVARFERATRPVSSRGFCGRAGARKARRRAPGAPGGQAHRGDRRTAPRNPAGTPPRRPAAADALAEAAERIEALSQAAQPAPQQFGADGRPLFASDVEWVRWLIEHPEGVTAQDRNGLRDAMRSPSFRLELEMNGVAATPCPQFSTTADR